MSDTVAGSGGGAPAAAPSGGAAPSAPSGTPATPAAGGAPARQPVMWTPKDGQQAYDISEAIENHLRSYKRKIAIDGAESEVDIETAFRAASLEPASRKRFTEADKIRRSAEAKLAEIQHADRAMSDPARIPTVLRKRMGHERYEMHILREADAILAEREMKPADRERLQAERTRLAGIEERDARLRADEARSQREKAEAAKARQRATRERINKEWPPIIESLGVPKGFVGDVMKAMIGELNQAQKLGIRITENEAAQRCAAELKRKIGVTAPPPPTPEVVQQQPGRDAGPPAPRDETGRFTSANGRKPAILRPDHIRDRLAKL